MLLYSAILQDMLGLEAYLQQLFSLRCIVIGFALDWRVSDSTPDLPLQIHLGSVHLQAMPVPWETPRKQGKESPSITSAVVQKPLECSFGRVGWHGWISHSFLCSRLETFLERDQTQNLRTRCWRMFTLQETQS